MDNPRYEPSYLALYHSGELAQRVAQARQRMTACTLCPVTCRANRQNDECGECGIGRHAVVASASAHLGEESVLRGTHGSGTVFFHGCNLGCVFCQNADISQSSGGIIVSAAELANLFLALQERGCHNLNLVTPSHVIAPILEALLVAVEQGFHLPIVYNSSAYDALPALRLLEGIVDMYMPDLKYADSLNGARYSGVTHYWEVASRAVKEMHRQVGPLVIEHGLARRGLLIRHLVLPGDLAGTAMVLRFLADEIARDTWVNLMAQYYPTFRAGAFPELCRHITNQEYADAVAAGYRAGLYRGIPFDHRN